MLVTRWVWGRRTIAPCWSLLSHTFWRRGCYVDNIDNKSSRRSYYVALVVVLCADRYQCPMLNSIFGIYSSAYAFWKAG